MSEVRRAFISVRGLPTKVVKLGVEPEETLKELILIIPGNPGLASYYEEYMLQVRRDLSQLTEAEPPHIWAVSHVGHDLPEELEMPKLKDNEDIFSLSGQTRHKLWFIEDQVPADCRLTLLGHSVGCKVAMDIMAVWHREQEDSGTNSVRLENTNALMFFPMIQRMYETRAGFFAWIQAAYFSWTAEFLALLLNALLPRRWLRGLISWHLGRAGEAPSDCCVVATMDLLKPEAVRNALHLAYTEILSVKELDWEMAEKLSHKMRFYFGTNDAWCPMSYVEDTRCRLGENLRHVICDQDVAHAFVLGHAEPIAKVTAQWFLEARQRQ